MDLSSTHINGLVQERHNSSALAMDLRTLTKISLATLQPVEQRGTSIFLNGHNIANTACIHFKFGTVNNRYMPNSKPMKLGKT